LFAEACIKEPAAELAKSRTAVSHIKAATISLQMVHSAQKSKNFAHVVVIIISTDIFEVVYFEKL